MCFFRVNQRYVDFQKVNYKMITSWSGWYWHLGLVSLLGMGGAIAFCNHSLAQIAPDSTLGSQSSVVTPQTRGSSVDVISGGATRGANLFHSFEQFSVQTGRTAFFNNAADIQNIISRVTGSSISNIDGLIRANGAANLFLLNPNGIIFGQNARLDIGGSFVASTANSIKFADGVEFSAKTPQTTPLLTINVPIGLQFGGNPGGIQVQGDGQGLRATSDLIDNTTGLRVPFNQTLALVGGDLDLEGATLKTAGGRIELGSVAGEGLVNIAPIAKGFALGYEGVQNLGNIQLTQQSAVDASGAGGGDIQVAGRRIAIANGSQIKASTLGAEAGGDLAINARELLQVIGTSADGRFLSGLFTESDQNAIGDAGDLSINTGELLIQNGARVSARTFGSGKGGNLTVTASDKVQLIGRSADGRIGSLLTANTNSSTTGKAGDLSINTGELLIQDGGVVSASTFSGKGGNLTVTATNKVQLQNGGQVGAATFGSGKGGNLTVTADKVQLTGRTADGRLPSGLFVEAEPRATGDAGDLKINTQQLQVRDGAVVSAVTYGSGKGGNLTVTATDKVQLTGRSTDGRVPSGLFTRAESNSTGAAGDLRINTRQLQVQDRAEVTVASLGTGNAGNLTIDAGSIRLDNGTLTADTRSVNTNPNQPQATITLRAQDLVLLRHGSNITTNAIGSNVIGGDINIDTNFLVAIENSDISANSTDFRGGRVTIEASGIFGTQFRNAPTPESDITATGANPDFSGTVELNILDVDPSLGLVELPENLVDASQQIAQGCTPRGGQTSSFVATGRGGLPDNPSEMLSSDAIEVNLATLNPQAENRSSPTVSTNPTAPAPIVEAQGWVIGKNGEVILTAFAPTVTPQSPGLTPESCIVLGAERR